MNIERVGYVLAALLTHSVDEDLSLQDHNLILQACIRIAAKADPEDLKTTFCANPKVAIAAAEDFDKLTELFKR